VLAPLLANWPRRGAARADATDAQVHRKLFSSSFSFWSEAEAPKTANQPYVLILQIIREPVEPYYYYLMRLAQRDLDVTVIRRGGM